MPVGQAHVNSRDRHLTCGQFQCWRASLQERDASVTRREGDASGGMRAAQGHMAMATAFAALTLLACVNEEPAARADAARDVVRSATSDTFAALLTARFAAERACIPDLFFPSTVILTPGDTSARARGQDEQYTRRFEILRAVGLATREEVRPGDPDWRLPNAQHVDSGGTHRVVRYTLTERALGDAESVDVKARDSRMRLCFARRRLVSVDSVVTRGPFPGWNPNDGVTSAAPVAFVRQTIAFDSVAAWVPDVAQRDSLQDLLPKLQRLEGPQQRWASFDVRDGAWRLTSVESLGPL